MRISDWSSDVCSSDLTSFTSLPSLPSVSSHTEPSSLTSTSRIRMPKSQRSALCSASPSTAMRISPWPDSAPISRRSEEHTSELQSLMRISYAVFCLKKKKNTNHNLTKIQHYKNRP